MFINGYEIIITKSMNLWCGQKTVNKADIVSYNVYCFEQFSLGAI